LSERPDGDPRPRPGLPWWWRVVGLPLFVAGLLAVPVAWAGWRLADAHEQQLRDEARMAAGEASRHLRSWLDARLATLAHLVRTAEEQGARPPEDFLAQAEALWRLFSGLQAINWVDAGGVIRHVVPEEGNRPALGADLSSHPDADVRETLARAAREGRPARTGMLDFLQGGRGFAVYWPVLRPDGGLRGFVNGVFRVDRLVEESELGRELLGRHDLWLREVGGGPVWHSRRGDPPPGAEAARVTLPVVDRAWRLTLAPSPATLAARPRSALWLWLGGGFAALWVAWLLHRNALRAETLRRSEQALRHVIDAVPHRISVSDARGRILFANRALASALGRAPDELPGAERAALQPVPDEARAVARRGERVLESGRPVWEGEERLTAASGEVEIVDTACIPFADPRTGERAVLEVSVDVSARHRAESLRATLAAAMDQAGEALVVLDLSGRILSANRAFVEMMGRPGRDVRGLRMSSFATEGTDDRRLLREMRDTLAAGRTWRGRYHTAWPDGSRFVRDATVGPVRDASGRVTHFIGVLRDVSREQRLEEALRQSQKMEAVGRLAGGVAHDFNNLLTVIGGYAEALREELAEGGTPHQAASTIEQAAARAAELTRQLLAFSRSQALEPRRVDLNEVVRGLHRMLERLIEEDVEVDTRLEAGLAWVDADPVQLEQAIVNLCVNARDAMPGGGLLTIATSGLVCPQGDPSTRPALRPGRYVVVSVTDTGHGMDAATQERIFDPFFTTKEVGQGTGLGLSSVYGLAEQSGGAVAVESRPGKGATLSIFLPATGVGERARPEAEPGAAARPHGGEETVLVVEDELAIRNLMCRTLESAGYRVLQAADGREALAVRAAFDGSVDLLLSDVVMPGLGGPELRRALAEREPGLRALFVSGYARDRGAGAPRLSADDALLEKPFRPGELLERVRAALDGPAAGGIPASPG